MIFCSFVGSTNAIAIAMTQAFVLVACGTSGGRPPPLVQESPCLLDGGCNGPPINGIVDAGDAAPCLPKFEGSPRGRPAQGKVVELDDPTVPLIFDPHLQYATTTPLARGTVSVEIERPGCGLATGLTEPDGTFSVEGAAGGDVSIRLRPVDRPDLITTVHHLADADGIEYPIMTRAALAGLFALTDTELTPDPTKGQIVASIVNARFPPGSMLAGGTISSPARGTIGYDGVDATGPLGVAAVLNAEAEPYPGLPTTVTGFYPPVQATAYAGVAQDTVYFVIVGIH